jgi:hypothetical protein
VPTKTDRILSYLPSTFRAQPRPTALYSVADAFGAELQSAENGLAAVMQSHWVDHADRFEELLVDLPLLAALYGLGPHDEEGAEEFREHLKRYIRTFIEGTVTVQGVLRITAEALGLRIADGPDELDVWWARADERLTTRRRRLDDAATLVFGGPSLHSSGSDAHAAAITGSADLSAGVDVRGASKLAVAVDGDAPITIDLMKVPTPASATAEQIAAAVAAAVPAIVAGGPGSHLRLASPTVGATSALSLPDIDGDAAPLVLGLTSRRARGHDPRAAEIMGTADLAAGIDLDPLRYVRISVDRGREAEIDLRGEAPAHATPADLCDRINAALGIDVARIEGSALALRSPTAGANSALELLTPAAQDATTLVFGHAPRMDAGDGPAPARIVGPDVSAGLDLHAASRLAVVVDGDEAIVDCAGEDPAATRPGEVVAKLNEALGPVAGYDGHSISLFSTATGPAATVEVRELDEGDAALQILGLGPRSFSGADEVRARIDGAAAPVDLRAEHVVRVSVDGDEREVDLRDGAAHAGTVTPAELVGALKKAFDGPVAIVDGGRLALVSPTAGAAGEVAVAPLEKLAARRFVSRALMRGEAAEALLGVLSAQATGEPQTHATIEGQVDLRYTVDLSGGGWLRMGFDGGAPTNVPVAGPRPRATTLEEIVAAINGALGKTIAHDAGGRLRLVSPAAGSAGSLELSAPTPEDALEVVGMTPATVHGRDAVDVSFLGTVDLDDGVDLSGGGAVRLRIGGDEHEVDCAGDDPARTTITEVVNAVNVAFAQRVATIEGPRIRLRPLGAGTASRLELLPPTGGPDATAKVFGVAPPRAYRGSDAEPARVVGTKDLASGIPLVAPQRRLRVTVDAGPAKDVDLAGGAASPAKPSLAEAVAALEAALGPGTASHDGGHLVISSPTAGVGGRVTLAPYTSLDARDKVLGDVPAQASGRDGVPATITGTVDLLGPIDLSARSRLVLALDDKAPIEIDVAGATPGLTFLDEVVAAINDTVPGLAEATVEDRLRLRWSGTSLTVLPARLLEVVEYPPETRTDAAVRLSHGERWTIDNDGATESSADIELLAVRGIAAPAIVNAALGRRVRILTAVEAGGRLRLRAGPAGSIEASVIVPGRPPAAVPAQDVIVEPAAPRDDPADALRIVRGRSAWAYMECLGTRFDRAHFDLDHFSGGPCAEIGVFDASSWGRVAGAAVHAVFGDAAATPEPSVDVTVRWTRHAPGRFAVNLPADLPARFGGRFNEGRFGSGADQVERYPDAVTEPTGDPRDIAALVTAGSLLDGGHAANVPLGWSPVTLPFRRPRRLTIGVPGQPAAIYLREEGVPGFVRLTSRRPGPEGADIEVTARPAGPASFDVEASFAAARFESAREIVAGRPLSASSDDHLVPGPIGILEAKAAGIQAEIRRERTWSAVPDDHHA